MGASGVGSQDEVKRDARVFGWPRILRARVERNAQAGRCAAQGSQFGRNAPDGGAAVSRPPVTAGVSIGFDGAAFPVVEVQGR